MATFTSNKAAAGVATRSLHAGPVVEVAVYTASASWSAGDVIQMVKVPAGAKVVDVTVTSNTLVASGAAGWEIGDGIDTNRYAAGSGAATILETGIDLHTGLNYEYSAEDTVDVRLTSGSVSDNAASAQVKMALTYVMDQ